MTSRLANLFIYFSFIILAISGCSQETSEVVPTKKHIPSIEDRSLPTHAEWTKSALPMSEQFEKGLLIYEYTLATRPPYYEGAMPLKYRVAEVPGIPGVIASWAEFSRWKCTLTQGATIDAAKAHDSRGRLLAELTFIEPSQDKREARYREQHYAENGQEIFSTITTYRAMAPGVAFKIRESSTSGSKQGDYFFLLPI